MSSYENLVADAFRQKSSLPFSNENAAHARVIMKHILLNADKTVYLYSDKLPAKVASDDANSTDVYDWPELVEAAEIFLNKPDTVLNIKVAHIQNAEASRKFIELSSRHPSKVRLTWDCSSKGPNFMVNDCGSFRVEYETHQAIACANNIEVGNTLIGYYKSNLCS